MQKKNYIISFWKYFYIIRLIYENDFENLFFKVQQYFFILRNGLINLIDTTGIIFERNREEGGANFEK